MIQTALSSPTSVLLIPCNGAFGSVPSMSTFVEACCPAQDGGELKRRYVSLRHCECTLEVDHVKPLKPQQATNCQSSLELSPIARCGPTPDCQLDYRMEHATEHARDLASTISTALQDSPLPTWCWKSRKNGKRKRRNSLATKLFSRQTKT